MKVSSFPDVLHDAIAASVAFGRCIMLILLTFASLSFAVAHADTVQYRHASVDGIDLFYREAGDPQKPTLLLLHGFPSSSFMFRDLIPLLSDRFHVLAPDYPGMGYSEAPSAASFRATFDSVSAIVGDLLTQLNVTKYVVYMQDFGGPVGMRLAMKHPEQIAGLIIQNTPISLDGWDPVRLKAVQANAGPVTPERRAAAEARVVEGTSILLHKAGAAHPDKLNPDAWAADALALSDPEKKRIMTDLQLDIPGNLQLYPVWQGYIRTAKPKTLVVWGRNDPIFAAAGVDTIKQLNPSAHAYLYNTGHFALEEESADIAAHIRQTFATPF